MAPHDRGHHRTYPQHKGGDTIKPAYSYYTDKMWRYFIPRWKWHQEHGTRQTDFRDDVERDNYALCALVWDTLSARERSIQDLIYCTEYERVDDAVKQYASRNGMTAQAVWSTSHRIGRRLGVLKGLVADQNAQNNPPHTTSPDNKEAILSKR